MSEESPRPSSPDPSLAEEVGELARHLREAHHLDAATRSELASLLKELARTLEDPSPQTEQLAESTVELVRAVKDRHEPGLVEAARERVDGAIARAEAKAPVATEIVLQLIDLLAGLGI